MRLGWGTNCVWWKNAGDAEACGEPGAWGIATSMPAQRVQVSSAQVGNVSQIWWALRCCLQELSSTSTFALCGTLHAVASRSHKKLLRLHTTYCASLSHSGSASKLTRRVGLAGHHEVLLEGLRWQVRPHEHARLGLWVDRQWLPCSCLLPWRQQHASLLATRVCHDGVLTLQRAVLSAVASVASMAAICLWRHMGSCCSQPAARAAAAPPAAGRWGLS